MKTLCTLTILLVCISCVMSLDRKSYLKCGEYLAVDEYLESPTLGYYAVMQSDCNFVIYRSKDFKVRNALWSSATVNTQCDNPILINQKDGNVVIYNKGVASAGNALWSTGTANGSQCYYLIMQDDGNLVLYTTNFTAVWASGTASS